MGSASQPVVFLFAMIRVQRKSPEDFSSGLISRFDGNFAFSRLQSSPVRTRPSAPESHRFNPDITISRLAGFLPIGRQVTADRGIPPHPEDSPRSSMRGGVQPIFNYKIRLTQIISVVKLYFYSRSYSFAFIRDDLRLCLSISSWANLTETSFDTPDSSMVTPYMVSEASMVPRL